MATQEFYLEDSLSFVKKNGTKFVWLGNEPVDYIRGLLMLEPEQMVAANPNEVLHADKDEAERYKNHVFVCYHGVTSKYLADMLDETYKVESVSLRGGVTAIVGEIF